MNNPQKDIIFALDIGTRSVIGIVGRMENEMFHVLHVAREEHTKRAMLDGQIEDIEQVAKVAQSVKKQLEQLADVTLTKVCLAAAGRSLRMERATALVELPEVYTISDELISQLEAVAVVEAEEKLIEHDKDQRYFLVGYTVAQYALDRYPMTTLKGHKGQRMEADIVATFLPSQVVEGLYSVVQLAGLEVASLTLEPIAALNAVIPQDLHLLNLVLVDIGAGTSDIAVCRDGSVVGYTMATTAGDEITETIMKHYLVDFGTAENLKTNIQAESQKFTDVLGLEQIVSGQQLRETITQALNSLAREVAKQILAMNGCAPAAVFLAGGGSKLQGLQELVAEFLEIDARYVAIGGNNFKKTCFTEKGELNDPEFATPLGIAISAGFGLINDSYHITLNGKGAKLFRSGILTILDVLMMNGYSAAALIGRTGKNLAVMVNGNKKIVRGKPSVPGILRLNGESAVGGTVVSAADCIDFVPAIDGLSATATVGELLGDYVGNAYLNGELVDRDIELKNGDSITTENYQMMVEQKQAWARPLDPSEVQLTQRESEPEEKLTEQPQTEQQVQPPVQQETVEQGEHEPAQSEEPTQEEVEEKAEEPVQKDTARLIEIPLAELTVVPVEEEPQPEFEQLENPQEKQEINPIGDLSHYTPIPQGEAIRFAEPENKESLEEILKEFLFENAQEQQEISTNTQVEEAVQSSETKKVEAPSRLIETVELGLVETPEHAIVEEKITPIIELPTPVTPISEEAPQQIVEAGSETVVPVEGDQPIYLNGAPLELEDKPDGSPYYLMDLLLLTNIDFRNVRDPICMKVNGEDSFFAQELKAGDNVIIKEKMD